MKHHGPSDTSYALPYSWRLCAPGILVQEALPFGGFIKPRVGGSGNMWLQHVVGVHKEGQPGSSKLGSSLKSQCNSQQKWKLSVGYILMSEWAGTHNVNWLSSNKFCWMPSLCPALIIHLDGCLQGWCGRTQCEWLCVCQTRCFLSGDEIGKWDFPCRLESVFFAAWTDRWRCLLAPKFYKTRSCDFATLGTHQLFGNVPLYKKLADSRWSDLCYCGKILEWGNSFFVISVSSWFLKDTVLFQVGGRRRTGQEVSHARCLCLLQPLGPWECCAGLCMGAETLHWRVLSSLDRW